MSKLRHFFRLSSICDDLETRLLREEFRSVFMDDHIDDGSAREVRSQLSEVSGEMSSLMRNYGGRDRTSFNTRRY